MPPTHCHRPNFIKATQTGLSWTCHGLHHNHIDMSKALCLPLLWFTPMTFIETLWFHGLCLHNGTSALQGTAACNVHATYRMVK